MKSKLLITLFALLMGIAASNLRVVILTPTPQMHCESCEKKIKGNLRFEKGVKTIETNVEEQRVTITYDADKTNSDAIIKSFDKFGYKATEIKTEKPVKQVNKK